MASAANRRRADLRLLIAATFLGITPGYMIPVLATVELAERGVGTTVVGLFGATSWAAILVASPFTAAIARRLGPRRAYLLATAALLPVVAGFALTDAVPAWFAFAGIWGASTAVRWVVGESWAVELAPPEQRGHAVGLFETAVGAATFAGPALVGLAGAGGTVPFLMAAVLLLASLLFLPPVRPPDASGAEGSTERASSTREAILVAMPTMLVASMASGVFESATTSLLPAYGIAIGLSAALAVSLVTALGLGSFLLQYPVGRLADRAGTTPLLVGAMGSVLVGALVLALAASDGWVLWALAFIWGGAGGALYTLAFINAGQAFAGPRLVSATAALVAAYTLGGAVGPAVGGLALDLSPRYGLPTLFAAVAALGALAILAGPVVAEAFDARRPAARSAPRLHRKRGKDRGHA